jgi:predicted transcriptional regulator
MNDLDKEVMGLLWEQSGSFTIHQIFEELNTRRTRDSREVLKFPTLQSVIRRLIFRGHIKAEKESRTVYYSAARKRTEHGIAAMKEISQEFFGIDFARIAPHLSSKTDANDEDIQELLNNIKKLNEK